MISIIEKLRSLPEADRKKVLFVLVFVFMAIVIFFWAINMDTIFEANTIGSEVGAEVSASSPFSLFAERLSLIRDTISGEIDLIKK